MVLNRPLNVGLLHFQTWCMQRHRKFPILVLLISILEGVKWVKSSGVGEVLELREACSNSSFCNETSSLATSV